MSRPAPPARPLSSAGRGRRASDQRAVIADARCTVVVATRDRHDQLAATLPRHLALPERPRVLVIDDASAEPVIAPGAEVIRLRRGAGGAARNAGARASRTPYLVFTDDDAWWSPGALRIAADLLDTNPRLAVVQPHVLVGSAERDDPTCAAMRTSPLPNAPGQPGRPILSFIACAVVIRREAILSCGGFSPHLGTGGEEQLLSWDLAAAGWQLSYVPEVIAHHDPPPAPDGRPARQTATIRNALWTMWLRRPLSAAAGETVAALARATHDRTTAHALRDAILGGRWVLRQRKATPPHGEGRCRAPAGERNCRRSQPVASSPIAPRPGARRGDLASRSRAASGGVANEIRQPLGGLDRRQVRVGARHGREDRGVGHPEVLDAEHPSPGVDDRARVVRGAHAARATDVAGVADGLHQPGVDRAVVGEGVEAAAGQVDGDVLEGRVERAAAEQLERALDAVAHAHAVALDVEQVLVDQ